LPIVFQNNYKYIKIYKITINKLYKFCGKLYENYILKIKKNILYIYIHREIILVNKTKELIKWQNLWRCL